MTRQQRLILRKINDFCDRELPEWVWISLFAGLVIGFTFLYVFGL